MLELLILGLVLGLSAGLAPGPLLTLVIAETLRHGTGAGIRVALAPLVTDLPLILLTVLILSRLADSEPLLGVISLIGAAFVGFMGYETLRAAPDPAAGGAAPPASLAKGLLANVLSPYPYLFWLSVGGPILTRALAEGLLAPLTFLVSFYALLVGAKILLAILVGRSRAILTGRWYRWLFGLLGMALCVLALGLARDGLRLLGLHGAQDQRVGANSFARAWPEAWPIFANDDNHGDQPRCSSVSCPSARISFDPSRNPWSR